MTPHQTHKIQERARQFVYDGHSESWVFSQIQFEKRQLLRSWTKHGLRVFWAAWRKASKS